MHSTHKLFTIAVTLTAAGFLAGCQPQQRSAPEAYPIEVRPTTPAESATGAEVQATEYQFVADMDGQTAADLLTANTQVEFIDYDFGQFVQAINGLAGDADYYWAFYINGESATQSVDNTVLQAGDTIELVYQAVSDFEMTE